MARRLSVATVVAWTVAAALIAISVREGRQLQSAHPEVFLGAAPLVGRNFRDGWNWRFGWGLVGASLVAVATAWTLWVGLWWRWSVRTVAVVTSVAAGAFAVLLALTDGTDGLLYGARDRTEYLANVGVAPPVLEFLRDFVTDIDRYSVHVRGHPPGFLVLLKLFDGVGLGGAWPVVALSIAGTMAVPLAVLTAVRVMAGDVWMRNAAPALVVCPYAIWMVTSADAVFTAIGAWAVATCVLGLFATGRRAVLWGLTSGLLLGLLLFMTYGGATFSIALAVPIVVTLRRRSRGALAVAGSVIVGVGAVTAAFALLGFWWLDGARETGRQYWAGTAQFRPLGYFAIANLAVALIAIGPLGFAGLVRMSRDWRALPPVWPLVVGGLLALLASHASQYTRAEVERIWLLFYPWIVISAGGLLAERRPRAGAVLVAVQAGCAVVLQAALVSKW